MMKMVEEDMKQLAGFKTESPQETVNRIIEENEIDETKIVSITFRKPTCVNVFYKK